MNILGKFMKIRVFRDNFLLVPFFKCFEMLFSSSLDFPLITSKFIKIPRIMSTNNPR